MSVGGKVIEVIDLPDEGRVWINTLDHQDECAIYVERTDAARSISEGDSLWWQGQWAMWTPVRAGRPFSDFRLRRLGGSGVNRPTRRPHA